MMRFSSHQETTTSHSYEAFLLRWSHLLRGDKVYSSLLNSGSPTGTRQELPEQDDYEQPRRGVRAQPRLAAQRTDVAAVDRTYQQLHRFPPSAPGINLHHLKWYCSWSYWPQAKYYRSKHYWLSKCQILVRTAFSRSSIFRMFSFLLHNVLSFLNLTPAFGNRRNTDLNVC